MFQLVSWERSGNKQTNPLYLSTLQYKEIDNAINLVINLAH